MKYGASPVPETSCSITLIYQTTARINKVRVRIWHARQNYTEQCHVCVQYCNSLLPKASTTRRWRWPNDPIYSRGLKCVELYRYSTSVLVWCVRGGPLSRRVEVSQSNPTYCWLCKWRNKNQIRCSLFATKMPSTELCCLVWQITALEMPITM
jgi:hypothetical protein